jgi:quercetin dioxygenase-like cupin family protein
MQYKVDFTSMTWESPLEGMQQKVLAFGRRQIRLVEYSKDLVPHWCEKGHVGYILQGQLEVMFEHETLHYLPGNGIVIPAGCEHKHMARALTDTVTVFFIEDI